MAELPYSQHPYQYGLSDPVQNTDPSGRFLKCYIDFARQMPLVCELWSSDDWQIGEAQAVDQIQDPKNRPISGLMALSPLGAAKAVLDGALGQDVLTGEPLPWWQRILGLSCVSELSEVRALSGVRAFDDIPLIGQELNELAALYSKGGSVGPVFNAGQLKRILRDLEKQGVTVYRGADAERLLRSEGAGALYWSLSGGPGVLVLADKPTRLQVIEELIHLEQHRSAGWVGVEGDALERARREIEAQHMLLDIAARDGWTAEEVERIRRNLEIWLQEYQKAAGG
jgi:hypothetical protein